MKPSRPYPLIFLMLVSVLACACTTASVDSAWKDPAYRGHPSRIMVIGVVKNQATRRILEDEFVRQLAAHGTEAIASYSELPEAQQGNDAAIAEKVQQIGIDAVLITRLVGKNTVQVFVPGTPIYPPDMYRKWDNYYKYGYQTMYTRDHMVKEKYAVIETNLYETVNNELIWTASSETGLSGSKQPIIKPYVGVMVENMIEQGLLDK